jgi:transposase
MLNRFTPLVAALVPSAPGLRVDEVRQTDTGIVIAMTSTHATAHCPRCRSASRRVRSCYQRTLADLPWSSCVITLLLTVRKFACDVAACPQRIFVERLPTVTVPYARRTNRLTDVVRAIAFATGGAGGQRLLERIGMPGSGTTLLRLIRRTPVLAGHTPRVLGIDDWARRKGQTYGTILVDLERHRPVDLLPERDATLVARWLQAHPGVKIISRDRGSTYVDGATLGVPDAVQVADRWHLLHNLADALERVLTAHRAQIRHVLQPVGAQRPLDAAAARVQQIGPPARSARAQEEIDTRRTMRLARYETVLALREPV